MIALPLLAATLSAIAPVAVTPMAVLAPIVAAAEVPPTTYLGAEATAAIARLCAKGCTITPQPIVVAAAPAATPAPIPARTARPARRAAAFSLPATMDEIGRRQLDRLIAGL